MQPSESKIALLVDADNAPASKIAAILTALSKYGATNIRRAYGNWKSDSLKAWEEKLYKFAIYPVQQFDYTKGKNASDVALIIDAMDLLYNRDLDGFAIVSSDSDFTPLAMRIRTNGLQVYGFGEQKTPLPFVLACSRFFYLEGLGHNSETKKKKKAQTVTANGKKSPAELKQDTQLLNFLRQAIATTKAKDGWSNLAAVGTHLSSQKAFDLKKYGYKKLSSLFQEIDLFEIKNCNKTIYLKCKK